MPPDELEKTPQIESQKSSDLLIGFMPDCELRVSPRCLFFLANESYKRPQYSYFTIHNRDKVTVAFRFRTKDRDFLLFSPGHGFLFPGASRRVTILVTDQERWVRNPKNYVGRVHKVVVENLAVNSDLKIPDDEKEQKALSRQTFVKTRQATGNRNELALYTKIRIVLPACEFDASIPPESYQQEYNL